MVLKLNEYVRTKNGIIAKVIGVQSGGIEKYFFDKEVHNLFNYLNGLVVENVVIKHSFNIIDLIEEGDYVNGNLVLEIGLTYLPTSIKKHFKVVEQHGYLDVLKEHEINSILTKEQFKAMEYEVK